MSSASKRWIVVCVSDTHNRHRQLTDRLKSSHTGDILIHAGDITNFGRGSQPFDDFDQWLSELDFKHKFIVGGNHEIGLVPSLKHGHFLQNEQVIIDDCLHIYGSSWRPVNESTWLDIPMNSHIVVTHNPPYSSRQSHVDFDTKLQLRLNKVKPLLSVFGHIHDDYGVWKESNGILFANASACATRFHGLNDPLRFKISMNETSNYFIEHLT